MGVFQLLKNTVIYLTKVYDKRVILVLETANFTACLHHVVLYFKAKGKSISFLFFAGTVPLNSINFKHFRS